MARLPIIDLWREVSSRAPSNKRLKGRRSRPVAAVEAFAWQHDCRRVEVTSGDHPGSQASRLTSA